MTDSGQEPPGARVGVPESSTPISRSGKRANARRRRRRHRGDSETAANVNDTGNPSGGSGVGEVRAGNATGDSDRDSKGRRDGKGRSGKRRHKSRGPKRPEHAPDHAEAVAADASGGIASGAGRSHRHKKDGDRSSNRVETRAVSEDQSAKDHPSKDHAKKNGVRHNANGAAVEGHGTVATSSRSDGQGENQSGKRRRRRRGKKSSGADNHIVVVGQQTGGASETVFASNSPGADKAEPVYSGAGSALPTSPVSDGVASRKDGRNDGLTDGLASEKRSRRRRRKRSRNPSETAGANPQISPQIPPQSLQGGKQTNAGTPSSTGTSSKEGGAPGHPASRQPALAKGSEPSPQPGVDRGNRHADPVNGYGGNRFGRYRNGYPATNPADLYAALDLGTNNCRLLIARPEGRSFRVVDAYSRIVRLGEGVGASGRLSDQAMERAIEALGNCQKKLLERQVSKARLIATEACRAAENGDEFIRRVQAETGLALEVVSRETEARLAVAGCVSLVDQEAEGVLLFDIGGGSSEIVWLDLRNRCGARGFALTRFIRSWTSLPVGVVNLAERHGGVDVTEQVFENMVADVSAHLEGFALGDDLSAAIKSCSVHMLGTSGTVTTLAGVHLGLKRYDRRRVDGAWLEEGQVSAMIDRLRGMPYQERVDNPCIGADRADLVLAGCAILEAIRRRWTCSRLRVADRGLREGILTELMSADGVWTSGKTQNRHSRRDRNKA